MSCNYLPATTLCGAAFKGFPVTNTISAFNALLGNLSVSSTFTDADHGCTAGSALDSAFGEMRYQYAWNCIEAVYSAVLSGCTAPSQIPLLCPASAKVAVDSYVAVYYSSACQSPPTAWATSNKIDVRQNHLAAMDSLLNTDGYSECLLSIPADLETNACGFMASDDMVSYCESNDDICCTDPSVTTLAYVDGAAVYPTTTTAAVTTAAAATTAAANAAVTTAVATSTDASETSAIFSVVMTTSNSIVDSSNSTATAAPVSGSLVAGVSIALVVGLIVLSALAYKVYSKRVQKKEENLGIELGADSFWAPSLDRSIGKKKDDHYDVDANQHFHNQQQQLRPQWQPHQQQPTTLREQLFLPQTQSAFASFSSTRNPPANGPPPPFTSLAPAGLPTFVEMPAPSSSPTAVHTSSTTVGTHSVTTTFKGPVNSFTSNGSLYSVGAAPNTVIISNGGVSQNTGYSPMNSDGGGRSSLDRGQRQAPSGQQTTHPVPPVPPMPKKSSDLSLAAAPLQVAPVPIPPQTSKRVAKVTNLFEAQADDELALTIVGEEVVIFETFSDGWAFGATAARKGFFPLVAVEGGAPPGAVVVTAGSEAAKALLAAASNSESNSSIGRETSGTGDTGGTGNRTGGGIGMSHSESQSQSHYSAVSGTSRSRNSYMTMTTNATHRQSTIASTRSVSLRGSYMDDASRSLVSPPPMPPTSAGTMPSGIVRRRLSSLADSEFEEMWDDGEDDDYVEGRTSKEPVGAGSASVRNPLRAASAGESMTRVVMVVYAYAAEQSDELTLVPGARVSVVKEFEDGWALGVLLETGRKGAFPMTCCLEVQWLLAKALCLESSFKCYVVVTPPRCSSQRDWRIVMTTAEDNTVDNDTLVEICWLCTSLLPQQLSRVSALLNKALACTLPTSLSRQTLAITTPPGSGDYVKGIVCIDGSSLVKAELTLKLPHARTSLPSKVSLSQPTKTPSGGAAGIVLPQIAAFQTRVRHALLETDAAAELVRRVAASRPVDAGTAADTVLAAVARVADAAARSRAALVDVDEEELFPLREVDGKVCPELPEDLIVEFYMANASTLALSVYGIAFHASAPSAAAAAGGTTSVPIQIQSQLMSHFRSMKIETYKGKAIEILDEVYLETSVPGFREIQPSLDAVYSICANMRSTLEALAA
ncbi:hypothetical protein HDU83_003891 [Entophlyctis luteolus]|nr:hypothetical protein HDU83_003891 [Entophlyctis luteolus]